MICLLVFLHIFLRASLCYTSCLFCVPAAQKHDQSISAAARGSWVRSSSESRQNFTCPDGEVAELMLRTDNTEIDSSHHTFPTGIHQEGLAIFAGANIIDNAVGLDSTTAYPGVR